MEKLEQLYEGKAKKVFKTDDPEAYIVSYKDDATAFNGEKKGTIVGKGAINNQMSNLLMQMLEKHGVPTPVNDFFYARIREIEAGWARQGTAP